MALDLKNLSIRTVSGLVYAGLLIGAIVCGPLASGILMALFAILASYELESNTVRKDNPSNWFVTWLLDAAILAVIILSMGIIIPLSVAAPIYCFLLILRFLFQIFISQKNPLKSISLVCLEQFYVGLPLCGFVAFVFGVSNTWIVVCALSMIWINDTGAYLIGSLFGRHRLYEILSPKKSWEGFIGGLIFTVGASIGYFYIFKDASIHFPILTWILIGIVVAVVSTLGDLFESMIKRNLETKDSGSLIPGHGGILDRIDSLLFVVPCLLLIFALFN